MHVNIDINNYIQICISIYIKDILHTSTHLAPYIMANQIPSRHAWVAKEALDGLTVTKEPMEQLSPPVTFPAG